MIKHVYYRLPAVLQDALVTLEGYRIRRSRFGKSFQMRLRDFIERDSWDEEMLLAYKTAQRARALERAAQAPFYRDWFNANKANWRDFVEARSFCDLPIVGKADLVPNPTAFLIRPPIRSDKIVSTSGTTGTSFEFPISSDVEPDQWAVWWRYRIRHGIKYGMRCGLFASAPILHPGDGGRPYRVNRAGNEIRFSIFHISSKRAKDYADAFERHAIRWVHGNPTAIAQFCISYIESGGAKPIKIDYLTVGSENLTPWQVSAMHSVFNISPKQHYGLAEAVCNISELPNGRFAVDEDFSYTEFIDSPYGDLKKIVGTSYSNKAIALLRYDTGDLCELAPYCDRDDTQRYVKSLDGRSTDYIQLPGNRRVASLAAPFHASEGLAGAQLVQHKDHSLTVRYIPVSNWEGDIVLERLEAELRKRIGPELPIRFERVEMIPKTERGKTRLVISEIERAVSTDRQENSA